MNMISQFALECKHFLRRRFIFVPAPSGVFGMLRFFDKLRAAVRTCYIDFAFASGYAQTLFAIWAFIIPVCFAIGKTRKRIA